MPDPAEGSKQPSGLRCPICAKPAKLEPPAFPFCSTRCKAIDMGSWLDGAYESQMLEDDHGEPDPPIDLL